MSSLLNASEAFSAVVFVIVVKVTVVIDKIIMINYIHIAHFHDRSHMKE